MLMSSSDLTGTVDLGEGEVTYQWLLSGPFGNCEWCHFKVYPEHSRLQLHDGKGKVRRGSKGQASSYICTRCAGKRGLRLPKKERTITAEPGVRVKQGEMFRE